MGSCVFDFLLESYLSNVQEMLDMYSRHDESELRKELTAYRQHVLLNYEEDIRSASAEGKLSVMLEVNSRIEFDRFLREGALYLDTVFIPDPIFEYTIDREKEAEYCAVGHIQYRKTIDRVGLVKAVRQVCALSSCFSSNYVVFIPSSMFDEPPDGWPSLSFDANLFNKDILRYFQNNSTIKNMEYIDGKYYAKLTKNLKPGPVVEIRLPQDGAQYMAIRQGYDPNDGLIYCESKQAFEARTNNVLLAIATQEMKIIYCQLVLAEYIGTTLMATRRFTGDILKMAMGEPQNTGRILDLASDLQLTIASNLTIDDIMHLRCDYGEAFASFRKEYKEDLQTLSLLTDDSALRNGIQMIDEKYNEYGGKFKEEIVKGCKAFGASVVLAGISLSSNYPATNSIMGYIASMASPVYEGIKNYRHIISSPSYFTWNMARMNESKRKGKRKELA